MVRAEDGPPAARPRRTGRLQRRTRVQERFAAENPPWTPRSQSAILLQVSDEPPNAAYTPNGRDRVAYEDAKDRAETAGTAFYVLSGAAAVAAGWAGFVWLTLPAEAGSGRGVGGRLEWSW